MGDSPASFTAGLTNPLGELNTGVLPINVTEGDLRLAGITLPQEEPAQTEVETDDHMLVLDTAGCLDALSRSCTQDPVMGALRTIVVTAERCHSPFLRLVATPQLNMGRACHKNTEVVLLPALILSRRSVMIALTLF